jgi:phage head maturation protease
MRDPVTSLRISECATSQDDRCRSRSRKMSQDWDFSAPIAVRTITKASQLYDVGPVTFPAYDSTSVDVRKSSWASKRSGTPLWVVEHRLWLAHQRAR